MRVIDLESIEAVKRLLAPRRRRVTSPVRLARRELMRQAEAARRASRHNPRTA